MKKRHLIFNWAIRFWFFLVCSERRHTNLLPNASCSQFNSSDEEKTKEEVTHTYAHIRARKAPEEVSRPGCQPDRRSLFLWNRRRCETRATGRGASGTQTNIRSKKQEVMPLQSVTRLILQLALSGVPSRRNVTNPGEQRLSNLQVDVLLNSLQRGPYLGCLDIFFYLQTNKWMLTNVDPESQQRKQSR